MKQLIIAEKPSVGQAIAHVIGATQKHKGYLEGKDHLVSWCVGHLVELAAPSAYSEPYATCRAEDLPILPDTWQYAVSEATKPQYNILRTLMNDARVTGIICATDAGREGELIFRLVYQLANCQKPVQRLWIASMEDEAIREGLRCLKPATEYDALYRAALCRAQADWLVGINATRLYSILYHQTLHIGRVMTPTLAMLVQREAQIAAFQPTPLYHVRLDCGQLVAASERLVDRAQAEQIAALCYGKEARIVDLTTREQIEKPPLLYDLTSLQRDANRLLGYTAQQTLDYAQMLYEKKLCTYPRTDSRHLTTDLQDKVRDLAGSIAQTLAFAVSPQIDPGQVIDDSKVSDHHAILPTVNAVKGALDDLPAGERSLLRMLMVRLLCAMSQPCRVLETCAALDCEGVRFTVKGRQTTQGGWRALHAAWLATLKDKQAPQEGTSTPLPALNEHMTFLPVTATVQEGTTTPPKHHTEDSLLAAMEAAGAEELPEDAERRGIGTPATRAGIIEKLVKTGLVERKGARKTNHLLPTAKGVSLITVLPEEIQSPRLTAEWEQKLKRIERGEEDAEVFMAEISEMVRGLVTHARPVPQWEVLFGHKVIGVCPRCKSPVLEKPKAFACSNHNCRFVLWRDNRFFAAMKKELTAPIVAALLKEGRVPLKGLYSCKTGKFFDATVVLQDTDEKHVSFGLVFGKQSSNGRPT